jgi:hypothetical protein
MTTATIQSPRKIPSYSEIMGIPVTVKPATPACFSSDAQFKSWDDLRLRSVDRGWATICSDCTREFESQMKKELRCQRSLWEQ